MHGAEGRLPEVLLTGGRGWCPATGWHVPVPRKWPLTWSTGPGSGQEPEHSAHSTALTESKNPKKPTIILFHFIAKIPTINLTTKEVSVSPASYSVSLRKQMIPHSKKKNPIVVYFALPCTLLC